jgi:inorganic pyrophosphatase
MALSDLAPFDEESGLVQIVIETPRGTRNKYSYDKGKGAFRLKKVLPLGQSFPFDFGFVPSTRAEDGDPIDMLVLMDEPAATGALVLARPIGVIEAEQTEAAGGKRVRNDRLLAVAEPGLRYGEVKTLDDLRPRLLDEIEAFFVTYNRLGGGDFEPLRRRGPKAATRLIEKAVEAAKKRRR